MTEGGAVEADDRAGITASAPWMEAWEQWAARQADQPSLYTAFAVGWNAAMASPELQAAQEEAEARIATLTRERDAAREQNIHGSEVRDILARQLDTANDQVHRLTQWLTSLFVPHDDCGHESGIHVAMCNAERLMRVQGEWNKPQLREQPTDTAEGDAK